MIHQCTGDCAHLRVPDLGGYLVDCPVTEDRIEREAVLRAFHLNPNHRDQGLTDRVDYLGALGPDEDRRHVWRVGGKQWRPRPVNRNADEGKPAAKNGGTIYRREVWHGSGQPVPPVDFSRPAETSPEPFPTPTLTSDMPLTEPSSNPAAGLLMLASSRGWEGTITHARGHTPHATHGRPSAKAKFSEAVRLHRGDQRAVAVRMDESWDSLWTWAPDQFFTRHATLAAFQEALT